jgi:endonuclease/exonuclease/phosphatase family metal-dependent hydrolase
MIFLFKLFKHVLSLLIILLFISCEPLVTEFDETEDGVMYSAQTKSVAPGSVDKINVMTWNIRFGAGRLPWFGDSCGDRVILSEKEVKTNLQGIADAINTIQPDVLIVNEIDVESKRTAYINQVRWLLDHTYFNYATFAPNWKVQFIPSDGLGRMNMGNAIFSRWEISESTRYSLALRGDQDALTEYFYLRRNLIKAKIELPALDNFYILATHLAAFSTDDTKKKQVNELLEKMETLQNDGSWFILAGDMNLLPPNASKTDYCLEDMCPGESFHNTGDDPMHKEGSYFTPEITWLQDIYDRYQPAVTLANYLSNESKYFTHTPNPDGFWDRKIDYLFTNYQWIPTSDQTHQDIVDFSDHIPVSADWEVPK